MASVASERIPIATLHPSLPAPATKSITALVTILWPYSSSTRTCALLLADPDFRLRRRRGQVRVQFSGDAAYAVATSQLGIGDKVVLKLGGIQWLQPSGEEEVVRTPGKSVDWELGFRDRLAMLVTRDGKQFANIHVERSTPEPEEVEIEEEAVLNTPSKIVGRFSAEGLRFNTWSSPAFLRHSRLSGGSLSDYDLFADEDESKSRKRRRTSFRNVGVWTYAARTPSPEKGDAMSVDEDGLASPTERVFASKSHVPALPQTPTSATNTPAEPGLDEEELIPESAPNEDALPVAERGAARSMGRKHLRDSMKEQDDALYEQYLEETHDNQGKDAEMNVFPDEPEDEPAAQFSLQDVEDIHGDSDVESLPSVLTDTDVAAPSAAASVRIDESAGDTELESDEDGIEVVEMSPTEMDSEEQESELSENESQETTPNVRVQPAPIRLSSTEEDMSEVEQASPETPSQPQLDQRSYPGTLKESVESAEDVDEHSETQRMSPSVSDQDIKMPFGDTEDSATSYGFTRAKEGEQTNLRSSDVENQPASIPEATPLSNLAAESTASTMPPPVLLLPQQDLTDSKSPTRTPLIGPVNAPSTPQLHPVASTALPLPSPFPGATEASSYMDARPSSLTEQTPRVTETGPQRQEEHTIRPATAMSVAQASQEALPGADSQQKDPNPDPVAQLLAKAPNVPQEDPQLKIHEEESHHFGLDGSVLSAVRASRKASREKPEIVDLQEETQAHESITGTHVEADHSSPVIGPEAEEEAPVREIPEPLAAPIKPLRDEEHQTPQLQDIAHPTLHEVSRIPGTQDVIPDEHGSSTSVAAKRAPGQALGTNLLERRDLPESDDTMMPVFEDDDWDMPDATAVTPPDVASTPKASNEARASENRPSSTPQKRIFDPSTSQTGRPPASSAVDIVDLGSDSSEGEEGEPSADVPVDEPFKSPSVRQKETVGTTSLPEEPPVTQPEPQADEPPPTQEKARTARNPPSTPQTRRRTRQYTEELASQQRKTRQSTVETVSQADTSTPSRSQKRNLRSSQTSRTPRASQETSGVAARVAQRRRRIEVKDSENEWNSNASISTQRPSSPSVPSDGPVPTEFEPSAGLEPSQVLGELSQMSQQTREESLERPSMSPITPVAPEPASNISLHASQGSFEDPHEAQNQRLQRELEGDTDENLTAERSSSPFPELDFKWGSKKQEEQTETQQSSQQVLEQEAQSRQSSILRDEYDNMGPTHSSMLQDDSSIIRAMRTSQFPFELMREEEQVTQSVEDDDSQQTIRAPSPIERKQFGEETQVEESQSEHMSQTRNNATHGHQSPTMIHEQSQDVWSSPPIEAPINPIKPTTRPQHPQESSILTPEASQELSQLQPTARKAHDDSHFPPTPHLTQATLATPSFSHNTSQTAEMQTVIQPNVKQQRDEALNEDTAMTDSVVAPHSPKAADDTTMAELPQPLKSSTIERTSPPPTQQQQQQLLQESLSQGTRTAYSYFTSLNNLRSFVNSPSQQLVDVLAVCTRPNKLPVRATAGARDYHTVFSITDASLLNLDGGGGDDDDGSNGDVGGGANEQTVRVQVFRPWKAALPELDVGDPVLLRGFAVKSSKKGLMLVSGEESAWCVFRYGHGHGTSQSQSQSQSRASSVQNGGPEDNDEEKKEKKAKKKEKRKSTIMDSTRPIWADVMSGLWGAVIPPSSGPEEEGGEQKEDSSEEESADEKVEESQLRRSLPPLHNPVSGATKEEVHGPPVEYGDEERRRAWELREWWVGGDGPKVIKVEEEENGSSVVKKEKKSESVVEANGDTEGRSERKKEEKAKANDIFRAFI
ncbi:Telomere end binding protein [Lasiodiplodia theobromae]|nr:Telomere end binding protein [Lasiodiplodia theobromae]